MCNVGEKNSVSSHMNLLFGEKSEKITAFPVKMNGKKVGML
jgi:hypothetical protein